MNDEAVFNFLMDDLEEVLDGQGYVPLYDFAWGLRGEYPQIEPAQIERVSHRAYEAFNALHDLRLVWTRWPTDLDTAWPAEPGTPLDFDLDPEGDVNEPLLVLVPA